MARLSYEGLMRPVDGDLAPAFAARRPHALGQAYDRYATLLTGVARQVLGDAAAAEDCVHDALLRVWRARDSYRPERGSLRAFLASCVRNEALTTLRGAGRRTERERRVLRLEPAPGDESAAALDALRVRAALARLPVEQRATIEYAYFANLSQAEIAARMDVPLGTVKGRVALAMRKLKAELAEDGA